MRIVCAVQGESHLKGEERVCSARPVTLEVQRKDFQYWESHINNMRIVCSVQGDTPKGRGEGVQCETCHTLGTKTGFAVPGETTHTIVGPLLVLILGQKTLYQKPS